MIISEAETSIFLLCYLHIECGFQYKIVAEIPAIRSMLQAAGKGEIKVSSLSFKVICYKYHIMLHLPELDHEVILSLQERPRNKYNLLSWLYNAQPKLGFPFIKGKGQDEYLVIILESLL